jgi:hypothetical protein
MKKPCCRDGCTRVVVTAFRADALCLDHFCQRCYQFLGEIESRTKNQPPNQVSPAELFLADECARRTIDICLTVNDLNNLDRARLLDILLWCGDVTASFSPSLPPQPISNAAAGAIPRFPYEKPALRRH